MGFISYSLKYYENELKKLETELVTAESIYRAKQLLKMLDDLVDEGYTELNEKLEENIQGVSRLRNYLKENGAEPFPICPKEITEAEVSYGAAELELVQEIDELMKKAVNFKETCQEPFLQELLRFCEWIGYEENTAYIFLLRDTLLPYVYYREKRRNAIYPWLIGRKTLEQMARKNGVDDEIRAAIIRTLEEGCADFEEFCESVLPEIRAVLKQYPTLENSLRDMLAEIKEPRILVVESGCSGTFPMLLASLDDRIDVRMYTTYPYLTEVYGDKIFTPRYEENRLFETMYSQDLYLQYSGLRDGKFYVKRCRNTEVEKKAMEELKAMMSSSLCGANCSECMMKEKCKGCMETKGCPFGKQCFIAEYISVGGEVKYQEFKQTLIAEFNELHIPGMPEVGELYALNGSFVNLEYMLPGGQVAKFLDDNSIYLGNQLECEFGNGRCFGIVAALDFLLVCTYGENGADPELVMYKRR